MSRRILMVFIAVLAVATSGLAGEQSTAAERSQQKARAVVERGIEALGGEAALRAMETLSFQVRGKTSPRLQMPTVTAPYEGGWREERLVFDLKGKRLLAELKGGTAGFGFWQRNILKGGSGHTVDFRARTVTEAVPAPGTPPFAVFYRRLPNLFLLSALDRPMTLRYLGGDTLDGRKQEVVSFVHTDNNLLTLYFDAQTHLLSKYDFMFADPIGGVRSSEILYSDYRKAGDVLVPSKWNIRQLGDMQQEMEVYDVAVNRKLDDSLFEPPPGLEKVPPPPQNAEVKTEKLADGVYLVRNLGGGVYHVLAVEFRDHIFVMEAPLSSDVAEAAIARIKEAIPGKPIRFLALSHHHADHSGGTRAFIAEGATVLTTAGNRELIQQMAAAHLPDRLGKAPRQPAIELVQGKHVLTDGQQTVELYDAGPNPHAREILFAYLPKHKILFQGDLFQPPSQGGPAGPAQPTTISFAEWLHKSGLAVTRLIGVHGRESTPEEMEQSVAMPDPMKEVRAQGQ